MHSLCFCITLVNYFCISVYFFTLLISTETAILTAARAKLLTNMSHVMISGSYLMWNPVIIQIIHAIK